MTREKMVKKYSFLFFSFIIYPNFFFINFYLNIIEPKETKVSADDLFNNDSIFSNFSTSGNKQNNKESKKYFINLDEPINNKKNRFCTDPIEHFPTEDDPKKLNIKNAFRINKYLKYGKGLPLWYIFHPVAKSSFGPCSTDNLEEMYVGNMVNGQSEVRFIDVYSYKNKKPFSFFKLKELDDPKFLDNIEYSSLIPDNN